MNTHVVPALWNSLEWAKLGASVATPLVLAILGIFTFRLTKRVEHRQWVNQKVIEKRLEVFEYMAPRMNDLYCFFSLVGHWKDLKPQDAIRRKREIDGCFYVNKVLFSDQFADDYQAFVDTYFVTATGENHDAKLRTTVRLPGRGHRATALGDAWDETWERRYFSAEPSPPSYDEIDEAYSVMMAGFSRELGIAGTLPRDSGRASTPTFSSRNRGLI